MSAGGEQVQCYTQKLDFTFSVAGEPGEIKDVRNSGVIKKVDRRMEKLFKFTGPQCERASC